MQKVIFDVAIVAKSHYRILVPQKYLSVADYLEQTGKTQEELATRLGISRSHVSLIADRKRQPPLDLALKIVRVTGVPIESLVRLENVEQAS